MNDIKSESRKLVIKHCTSCNQRQSVYNNQTLCGFCGFALVDYDGQADKMKIIDMAKPKENLTKKEYVLWLKLKEREIKETYKHYNKEFFKEHPTKDGIIFDEEHLEGEPIVEAPIYVVWEGDE